MSKGDQRSYVGNSSRIWKDPGQTEETRIQRDTSEWKKRGVEGDHRRWAAARCMKGQTAKNNNLYGKRKRWGESIRTTKKGYKKEIISIVQSKKKCLVSRSR